MPDHTDAFEVLSRVVRDEGVGVTDDPTRLRAFLADLLPDQRTRMLLVAAAEEKIPGQMRTGASLSGTDVGRFTALLIERRGIRDDLAAWAVHTWARALDMELPKDIAVADLAETSWPLQGQIDGGQSNADLKTRFQGAMLKLDREDLESALTHLEALLAEMEEAFDPDHPNVIAVRRQLADVRTELSSSAISVTGESQGISYLDTIEPCGPSTGRETVVSVSGASHPSGPAAGEISAAVPRSTVAPAPESTHDRNEGGWWDPSVTEALYGVLRSKLLNRTRDEEMGRRLERFPVTGVPYTVPGTENMVVVPGTGVALELDPSASGVVRPVSIFGDVWDRMDYCGIRGSIDNELQILNRSTDAGRRRPGKLRWSHVTGTAGRPLMMDQVPDVDLPDSTGTDHAVGLRAFIDTDGYLLSARPSPLRLVDRYKDTSLAVRSTEPLPKLPGPFWVVQVHPHPYIGRPSATVIVSRRDIRISYMLDELHGGRARWYVSGIPEVGQPVRYVGMTVTDGRILVYVQLGTNLWCATYEPGQPGSAVFQRLDLPPVVWAQKFKYGSLAIVENGGLELRRIDGQTHSRKLKYKRLRSYIIENLKC